MRNRLMSSIVDNEEEEGAGGQKLCFLGAAGRFSLGAQPLRGEKAALELVGVLLIKGI